MPGLRRVLGRLSKAVSSLLINQLKSWVLFSVGVAVGEWVRGRNVMKLLHLRRHKQGQRPASSLKDKADRCFAIVTTAAMPWRTGTSMNPMLRAAHLAHDGPVPRRVALVVPWVEPEQQGLIYPQGLRFESREEQAAYILEDARKRTGLPCAFQVLFYAGRYFPSFGSIFPLENIISVIPEDMRDVAVLEEPEHLTWFNHSQRWSDAFSHVVGIMHTNYLAYVREGQATGFLNAAAVYRVNRWVCRIHCDKVVKLSNAVQKLPHQVTCNVHGVAGVFLDVGRAKAAKPSAPGGRRFSRGAYFIGKAVWGKGYRELITLGAEYGKAKPEPLALDVIGSGEDLEAIQAAAGAKGLHWAWLGAKDHADAAMHEYQVFINPSTSDVVATTTAEALAMGKWVVVPHIACNEFFAQFRNCLTYKDAAGFVAAVDRALSREPAPLSEAELRKLSWEAATERLLEVGSIAADEWPSPAEQRYTAALWRMWRSIVGFTALREALGMTSTTGLDEPEVSESDEDEEQERTAAEPQPLQQPQPQHQQQQLEPAAAAAAPAAEPPAAAQPPGGPAAAAVAPAGLGGGPPLPPPPRRSEGRPRSGKSEEAKAARAAAIQAELLQARSMGGPGPEDWDLDWLYVDPPHASSHSAPAGQLRPAHG